MNASASTMGVSNDVTTRVGVCTYAGYENDHFRYVIEYNNKGLNGGRGFEEVGRLRSGRGGVAAASRRGAATRPNDARAGRARIP